MTGNSIAPVLLTIGVDYRHPPQPWAYEALEMIRGADWIEYENPDTAGWYLQAGLTRISWNCSLVAINSEYPRRRQEGLIVSLGRIDELKKQRLLVEAMPRVLEKCPNARLELAGDGPDRGALEEFTRAAGLEEVVHFSGWTSDPAQALSRADLAAYPSTSMGFDRVVIESMLLGVPVLTSHALAPVTHYGRFGAYSDDRSFAEAIILCLQDPDREEKAGQAREHALAHYSPEASLERTFRSYERIV
jgi:glycosyltransferase involved in cell wall biosynthesis